MSPDQVQAHMHRCLLRWICRASPTDRAKFTETSNRVRGTEETEALMAEARQWLGDLPPAAAQATSPLAGQCRLSGFTKFVSADQIEQAALTEPEALKAGNEDVQVRSDWTLPFWRWSKKQASTW